MAFLVRLAAALLFSAIGFGQLPSQHCDLIQSTLENCTYVTDGEFSPRNKPASSSASQSESFVALTPKKQREHFHWGRALFESFMFFSIEQAYVVHDDYRWVVIENGVPFNHYWRDYKQSLKIWIVSGWVDGDPLLYSYVGHLIWGSFTGYIQIQTD